MCLAQLGVETRHPTDTEHGSGAGVGRGLRSLSSRSRHSRAGVWKSIFNTLQNVKLDKRSLLTEPPGR